MKSYAVKCEKTITFYIDVEAENEWQAQNKAEYEHRLTPVRGYAMNESSVRTMSAVEINNEEDDS